jgi:hypothetical protein
LSLAYRVFSSVLIVALTSPANILAEQAPSTDKLQPQTATATLVLPVRTELAQETAPPQPGKPQPGMSSGIAGGLGAAPVYDEH